MAKYTTLLKTLIDSGYDIGLKDYPIFLESYRNTLNDKIIEHYSFREIGFETPFLFKHHLNERMNEIMPYYNQLYQSQEEFKKLKQFENKNYKEIFTGTISMDGTRNNTDEDTRKIITDTTNTRAGSTSTDSQNIYSDTPMNQLNIENIKAGKYATNVTIDNNTGTNTESNDTTETKTHSGNTKLTETHSDDKVYDTTKEIMGFDSDKFPVEILLKLRESFINIDMMIIEELSNLFMCIW